MYKKEAFVNPSTVTKQGSPWDSNLQRERMYSPSSKYMYFLNSLAKTLINVHYKTDMGAPYLVK